MQHHPLQNNELDDIYEYLSNNYKNLENIKIINFTRLVVGTSDLKYNYKTNNKNITNHNILCDNNDDGHLRDKSKKVLKTLNINVKQKEIKNDIKMFE